MIHYIDDFLPQDEFEALATRVRKGFRGNLSYLKENSDEPVRVTHHDHSGDWKEGCNFIGQECRPAIEKMITTMEDLGIQELKNWSIWYQYIIDTMTIPVHRDSGLRKSDQANTYTVILYTSDWQEGWGGEFIVGEPVWGNGNMGKATSLKNLTHTIAPKPNRMLIWSRDEWHAVQKVTNSDPNYIRSFFASGWSSIEVQQAKGEFYDI